MREAIYLSALFHDIGEFYKMVHDEGNEMISHEEASYKIISQIDFLKPHLGNMKDLIINHHNPKNIYEKIIQIADELSCKEEKYDEDIIGRREPKPMEPIFARILVNTNKEGQKFYYAINPLSLDNIFPNSKEESNISNSYRIHYNKFYNEIKKAKNLTQLLYILEKYLWCVPVYDKDGIHDVSIFEHLRNSAAIALCLYDQYEKGYLTEMDIDNIYENEKEQFILINGDVSGIQDFIMNVSSKGAAKSLKSHSIYISLITDIVVNYIIDSLDLKDGNLLYNGGGNFFILAPKHLEKKVEEVKKDILFKLLTAHDGDLYFAIDYIYLTTKDFIDFPYQWQKAVEKTNIQKYSKWKEIDIENNYSKVFGPFDEGVTEDEHCNLCGISLSSRKGIFVKEDDGISIKMCSLCKSYIDLTNKLKTAKYYILEKIEPISMKQCNTYQDIFNSFGYNIDFLDSPTKRMENRFIYKINETDFIDDCDGFKFGAYYLPNKNEQQVTFEELSYQSKGDNKLGILKLDVDNLGYIFGFGLKDNKTISRITTLSRMMGIYFEGYINKLIEKKGMKNAIYVVYSGGDDTFLIGPWDKVIDLTEDFYNKFREYTCYNNKITFSAGIGIFRYDYPVIRSINIVEESLEEAKNFLYEEEITPSKNKVNVLGEVFNWEEFRRIRNVQNLLIETIEAGKDREGNNGTGKALLYKIERSTIGFKKILEDSNKGKVDNLRFWRLAYYLKEVKNMDIAKGTNFAESIIEEYRSIVLNNLLDKNKDKNIRNIMIIPVATKLAQMEIRNIKERLT